jgi:hypothetical protein
VIRLGFVVVPAAGSTGERRAILDRLDPGAMVEVTWIGANAEPLARRCGALWGGGLERLADLGPGRDLRLIFVTG